MAIRFVPLAIAGGAGVVQGNVATRDANGFSGLPTAVASVAPLVAGIGLDVLGFNRDISEGLIFSGAALTGTIVTRALILRARVQQSPSVVPVGNPAAFPVYTRTIVRAALPRQPVVLG